MATPLIVATPALSATYNVGMAETFSWIPMEGAGRPLFARATYLANASDISVSLSASNLNINLADVENLIATTNTLVGVLTATSNLADVENLIATTNTLVGVLTATSNRINGFVIPNYNRIANIYYGASNNLSKVDYKFNSTIVASLSFTYATPTSADGALLAEVIKTL